MTIEQEPKPHGNFLRSRSGVAFLTLMTIAGLLLAYEHRAHVFTGTAMLVALLGVCIAMHVFMHGGRGGHERHARHAHRRPGDGRVPPQVDL